VVPGVVVTFTLLVVISDVTGGLVELEMITGAVVAAAAPPVVSSLVETILTMLVGISASVVVNSSVVEVSTAISRSLEAKVTTSAFVVADVTPTAPSVFVIRAVSAASVAVKSTGVAIFVVSFDFAVDAVLAAFLRSAVTPVTVICSVVAGIIVTVTLLVAMSAVSGISVEPEIVTIGATVSAAAVTSPVVEPVVITPDVMAGGVDVICFVVVVSVVNF